MDGLFDWIGLQVEWLLLCQIYEEFWLSWVEIGTWTPIDLIWLSKTLNTKVKHHCYHFYSGTSLGLTPRWTWPPFKAWTKSSTMLNRWIFCKAYVFVRLVFEFQVSVLDFCVVVFLFWGVSTWRKAVRLQKMALDSFWRAHRSLQPHRDGNWEGDQDVD